MHMPGHIRLEEGKEEQPQDHPRSTLARIFWGSLIVLFVFQNLGWVSTLRLKAKCIPDDKAHRAEIDRLKQGVYWTAPTGEQHCDGYSLRTYHAVLKSDVPLETGWLEVCNTMPIKIHGRRFDRPDHCERNVSILIYVPQQLLIVLNIRVLVESLVTGTSISRNPLVCHTGDPSTTGCVTPSLSGVSRGKH